MQNQDKNQRYHRYLNSDVGAIGIGSMIVFIAMVLVAGIAASVIIQTANTLEIKAMSSGEETKDEVGTGLRAYHIEAETGNRNISGTWYNNSFHNLSITVDVRAGSQDIDLSTTIVEISNSTVKCVVGYSSGEPNFASNLNSTGLFNTVDDSSGTNMYEQSASNFGIIVVQDPDDSCNADSPGINRGDTVKLTFNMTAVFGGLQTRTDVWGQVIPENGASGPFSFRTPPSVSDTIHELY